MPLDDFRTVSDAIVTNISRSSKVKLPPSG